MIFFYFEIKVNCVGPNIEKFSLRFMRHDTKRRTLKDKKN